MTIWGALLVVGVYLVWLACLVTAINWIHRERK